MENDTKTSRVARIPVPLTADEREIVARAAKIDGRSLANFIHRAALKEAKAIIEKGEAK